MELILGVDIGGTNTKYGAFDEKGKLCFEGSMPSKANEDFKGFVDAFLNEIEGQLEAASANLKAVGVGSPMGNPMTGLIEGACNLEDKWGREIPLVDTFNAHFKVPTFLMNDSNAAAVGEKYYGKGISYHNFLVLTLGTGLGCGIFSNGSLLIGKDGAAGEVGHTTLIRKGRPCNCGRLGCLETYVSATGLVKTFEEISREKGLNVPLGMQEAYQIAKAAENGDPIAREAFEQTGMYLGEALADLAVIFDPEAIILAGGLANAGNLLLDPVKKAYQESVINSLKENVKILISDTKEEDLAVLGAASYAREELSSDLFQITHEI